MQFRYSTAVLVLVSVHAGLLGWGAVVHSPTVDEVGWLPGGLAHWKEQRLDIVVNHPPLVGLVAAIPLLVDGADSPVVESPRGGRSIGREFIRMNGGRSFWLFTLGRWACIPFSIAGAIVCFLWARDLYGPRSGLLATTLWCFCPNILAQGQLVSHDVPACSFGLMATYVFWRWLRQSNWMRTVAAGLGLGLALLTKMTMLIHLAVWPLVLMTWGFTDREHRHGFRDWLIKGAKLLIIIFVAIDVLNLGYGFQGSFATLGSYGFRSQILGGAPSGRENRFAGSQVRHLPVPFPQAFIEGVDFQRFALEGGLPDQFSYLRGAWSTRGWPYYYLYALAIKVPLGTWCLLFLSIAFRLRRVDGQSRTRDEIVLLAPSFALLLASSASLVWTDHVRHILPSVPFVFIWISRFASVTHRWFSGIGAMALAWTIASSLWVYPHSMSYFNEAVGGPCGGHFHLLSSNIDFGQDLLNLKRWYDSHPEARPLGLAYWDFNSIDPHTAGIDFFTPPSGPAPGETSRSDDLGPKPGWYAVNVNFLHGDKWPGRKTYPKIGYYGYFLECSPVARAGYSIYIYHISVDEANRVRALLGLPPLVGDKSETRIQL